MTDELISRQRTLEALGERPMVWTDSDYELGQRNQYDADKRAIESVRPIQAKDTRYTKEELEVFAQGISIKLLSLKSAQRWKYNKKTAEEIRFLEELHDKVKRDIAG